VNRWVWTGFTLVVLVSFVLVVLDSFASLVSRLALGRVLLLLLPHYALLALVCWLACRFNMRRALLVGAGIALLAALGTAISYNEGNIASATGMPLWMDVMFSVLFNLILYSAVTMGIWSAWRAIRRRVRRDKTA
jgi:hypothetical protein